MVKEGGSEKIRIREATRSGGESLKRLFETNPDGGEIRFAPHFETDPYRAYTRLTFADDVTGFIAETPAGEAVGTGFVTLRDARVGGELRPQAYLEGLVVDREYRGRGVGKRLASERIRYAEDVAGDDVVISATIQTGNEASVAVARSWADGFPYRYVNHPVEPIADAPDTEYTFREADESELEDFVDGMNGFYDEAELFAPYDRDRLADLLATSVDGVRAHRCDVMVENGEFVAGAHVIERYKFMSIVVETLPSALEAADELPASIPEDGEIRPMVVVPWFKPGYADAADALLERERATTGEANRLTVAFDPDGPLGRVDALTPDEGTIESTWAIRGLDDPVAQTFVAPSVG